MPFFFEIYLFGTALLFLGYGGILIAIRAANRPNQPDDFGNGKKADQRFGVTILVPFRNEARHIRALCESLLKLKYPKESFEVIVIDDHSEDDGPALFQAYSQNLPLTILRLDQNKFGKKAALLHGVTQAKFPYILSTDADCVLPAEILLAYEAYQRAHPEKKFVAGPITFSDSRGQVLSSFQKIDLAATMLITHYGIQSQRAYMANGANYLIEADLFRAVAPDVYQHGLASGDDVFLVQSIAKRVPDSVGFLWSKAALVLTAAQDSWADLLRQRIRWASKSRHTDRSVIFWLQAMAFLVSLSMVAAVFFGCWDAKFFVIAGVFFGWKLLMDYYFVIPYWHLQGKKVGILSFISASVVYIPYIIAMGLVALGPDLRYRWKGRMTK